MSKRISGTKEWSVTSVNIILGCAHRCRYCYARADALRRRQIPDGQVWGETYFTLREKEVHKQRKLVNGTVMFPSTHDIFPEHLDSVLMVIGNILRAGNRILIVSKPHLECIQAICREFEEYREKILFRFTIGAMDNAILQYWEPGAPGFEERLSCLQHAFTNGFQTSVSCEPLLDGYNTRALFDALAPYVTDTIWIGKMNGIEYRVEPGTDQRAIQRVREGQTDENVRGVYAALKDEPKVRWKESYKGVLGLHQAEEAGLDI
ncbi:MAG: radical SAM protein [Thermoguttaceae bacterium]|jgi:DNA repair photolyase